MRKLGWRFVVVIYDQLAFPVTWNDDVDGRPRIEEYIDLVVCEPAPVCCRQLSFRVAENERTRSGWFAAEAREGVIFSWNAVFKGSLWKHSPGQGQVHVQTLQFEQNGKVKNYMLREKHIHMMTLLGCINPAQFALLVIWILQPEQVTVNVSIMP